MIMKHLFSSAGVVCVMLAGCGTSAPPPPPPPASAPVVTRVAPAPAAVAPTAAEAKSEASPGTIVTHGAPGTPDEHYEGYAGVAPPGKVAFGPAPRTEQEREQLTVKMYEEMNQKGIDPAAPPPQQNSDQH